MLPAQAAQLRQLDVGNRTSGKNRASAFLAALAPAGLEASLRAAEQFEADHDAALAQWRRQVERARYEAQRAERRYRAVDPDNRLVARGLEAEWEQLRELRGHEQYVMDLQFSPDGTMLVSGSGDFTVRLWDTLPRAERARLASEARALREQQRERVETLLRDLGDPARVAERLRAVRALDDAQRRAALRVLLETAGSAGDRAAPPPHRDAG